jgi:tetratricopeptide (TPR) repeat protein
LLPVLHILPVQFDPSLYHERYLMPGLALALTLLPRMIATISLPSARLRPATIAGVAAGMLWLGIAVINIRVTLPLWSNETKLWQWQAAKDQESTYAKVNLLALATSHSDRISARKLADELLAGKEPCFVCMIDVAALAMEDGDLARAKEALDRAQDAIPTIPQPRLLQSFVLATARLRELEHDSEGAAEAYHDAIGMGPLEPMAHMGFALFLARQGKITEARAMMDETLPLWPPDLREKSRQEFERTLAAAMEPTSPAAEQHQP